MPKINDIHTIIVPAETPNLTAHTYTEIYAGTQGCVVNINGTVIQVASSSNISILIRSISGGTGCYLLGENKNVFGGSPNLG